MENKTFHIDNETDLHKKVIEFIRKYAPDAVIIPGLGEYQFNSTLRTNCYDKGYTGGQPDILIINSHRYYQGLALEFKTPTGKEIISTIQTEYLKKLETSGYKCIISNDYDEIIVELINYFNDNIYPCGHCNNKRGYKTIDKLNKR